MASEEDDEEEIGFEELSQLYLMMGEPEDAPPVVHEFLKFVRKGCTEEQAEKWLWEHRDEFPEKQRASIKEYCRPLPTEEQILEIITRKGSKTPTAGKVKNGRSDEPLPRSEAEFMKRCEELHREGGVALQLPYILKYGNLFR
jgi:hypothetical protein